MKQFQQITITIPKVKLEEYLSALYDVIEKSTWTRRMDMEENIGKNDALEVKYICVQTPSNKKGIKDALLWLYLDKTVANIRLANIVPLSLRQLTMDQYNNIVSLFYEQILSKINNVNIKYNISAPFFVLQEEMCEQCARALQNFSAMADRHLGISKPLDFDLWARFVLCAFDSNVHIDLNNLQKWFEEEGWSKSLAKKLTENYNYSMDLLDYERKNR